MYNNNKNYANKWAILQIKILILIQINGDSIKCKRYLVKKVKFNLDKFTRISINFKILYSAFIPHKLVNH